MGFERIGRQLNFSCFRNYKCTWLIEAPSADSNIRLHLKEFATECSWDHLYIFDGIQFSSMSWAFFQVCYFSLQIYSVLPGTVTVEKQQQLILANLVTSGVQFSCPEGKESCENERY